MLPCDGGSEMKELVVAREQELSIEKKKTHYDEKLKA